MRALSEHMQLDVVTVAADSICTCHFGAIVPAARAISHQEHTVTVTRTGRRYASLRSASLK